MIANCPQADPVAGLNPTNTASRFVMTAAAITNPTTGLNLTYGPLAAGRNYRPWTCTNLATPDWSTPVINAGKASLTDTNPALPAKLYRLSIHIHEESDPQGSWIM